MSTPYTQRLTQSDPQPTLNCQVGMQLDTGLGIERGVIYAMFPGAVRSGHTHF